MAALEGRSHEALAGVLEALRAYAGLGLALLLPGVVRESAAAAAAVGAARETLTRLGAAPFLARLEAAMAAPGAGSGTVSGAVRGSAGEAPERTPERTATREPARAKSSS